MDGKQIPLGVFGQEQVEQARDALTAILANLPQNQVQRESWADRVARFLAHKTARGRKASTLESYAWILKVWLARFGTKAAPAITAEAVEDHANECATWGVNQRRNYLCAVQAFLVWTGHPLELDKPGRESAGAASVIPEPVHWQAVGAARGDLKSLLTFLWHTGCRPSEGAVLTADVTDWDSGTVRLREHKTRGSGKDRIVYLAPTALAVLKIQREKHGSGLLFRNARGTRFTDTGLAQAMWRISARIGHHVTAYGYRHSYCHRALSMGIPDTHVAALMGHSSTRMIHAHYGHLTSNARLLKAQAAKISSDVA